MTFQFLPYLSGPLPNYEILDYPVIFIFSLTSEATLFTTKQLSGQYHHVTSPTRVLLVSSAVSGVTSKGVTMGILQLGHHFSGSYKTDQGCGQSIFYMIHLLLGHMYSPPATGQILICWLVILIIECTLDVRIL